MILRDSGLETPGVCLVTSCCVYGSSCPKMALSCVRDAQTGKTQLSVPTVQVQASHVMWDAHVHTIVLSSYCEANQLASPCDSALQQDDRCYNIINEYNILRTSLYYTNQPWHTFCPRARWEALSCGREPLCSHAIMPLLSMWKTDVALITPEVAFEMWGSYKIILMTKTHKSSTTEMNASSLQNHLNTIILTVSSLTSAKRLFSLWSFLRVFSGIT